jgi:hypothetical protein
MISDKQKRYLESKRQGTRTHSRLRLFRAGRSPCNSRNADTGLARSTSVGPRTQKGEMSALSPLAGHARAHSTQADPQRHQNGR